MIAAGPAFTLLVAILLRRESATPAKWVGIALAASGAVALVGAGFGSGTAAGNLLALLNVACYSIYLVISRDVLKRYDALTVITWVFVYGTLGIAPWGAWGLASLDAAPSTATWLALAWIVVVPTVGAYYLNLWALKRVEASLVAVFVYLQPVLTAILAAWLLNEHPSPRLLPAAALIFAGVGVTVWAERRSRAGARAAAEAEDEAGALRCE
jgi:drug/metabolite transporter (DMT)-like permease